MATCLVTACGRSADDAAPGPEASPVVATDAPASTEAAPTQGCGATPELATVPDEPLVGEVDGRPFVARAVVFEQSLAGWVLRIHDTPMADPTARAVGGQLVEVALPGELEVGWKNTKAMGVGSAYWTAARDQNLAARRGAEAWAIELTTWSRRPWQAEGGVIQDLGRAAGRMSIVLHSDGGHCAWVAGRFEGAIIRQVGRPLGEAPPPSDEAQRKLNTLELRRERADFERRVRLQQERALQGYSP